MPKPLIAIAALVLLTCGLLVAGADPVVASTRAATEATLLQLIDRARDQRGLPALHTDAALDRAALGHSRDMMRRHYFSHWSPGGGTCATRARRAGYSVNARRSWAVSEVIGWGMGGLSTPQSVFKSWMKSPYHRSVLLGRRWRDVGVGCVSGTFNGASGSWMYTVDVGRRSR